MELRHHLTRHVEMTGRPLEEISPSLQFHPITQLHVGRIGGPYPGFPVEKEGVQEGDVGVNVLGRVGHGHLGDAVEKVLEQPFLILTSTLPILLSSHPIGEV